MTHPRTMLAAALAVAMMTMTVSLFAAERPSPPAGKSEPIYGYRLMTDDERNDYRQRMRESKNAEERQAIRDEHRKVMEARAKERGVTLPGPHGSGGPGKGPGYGPRGEGQARGQGMGPGYGKGKAFGPGGKPGWEAKGRPGDGKGAGPRAECPGAPDCPGPGAGKGPGPR